MSIEALIRELQACIDAGLPPGTTVYVREDTKLHGAAWISPRAIRPGYDPHPVSAPYPAPLVVFVS